MKFSWKICFSTMILSLIIFSIGGYVLISALFQSTYEREVANAGEENRLLQYSFVAYWNTTVQGMELNEENVRRTAEAMVSGMADSALEIRILGQNQEVLYDNTKTGNSFTREQEEVLLRGMTGESRNHMLQKTEGGYALWTASRISLESGGGLYLESIREVTELFEERESQYGIYRQWMAGLLAVQSIFCYLMAVWLLRPLRRLSRSAKRIAGGNLSARARIESRDEIGDLAVDLTIWQTIWNSSFRSWKTRQGGRRILSAALPTS